MRKWLSVLGAALIVCAGAQPAGAAVQIGETFEPSDTCSPRTRIQTTSPSDAYAAPFTGVITEWSFQSSDNGGSSPLIFKVARLAAPGTYTIVGESEFETAPDADAVTSYPIRISVQAGDVIGLYAVPASVFLCARSAAGYAIHQGAFGEELTLGSTTPLAMADGLQLGVSARLEADADGDGFGDESQDQCPTDATTQSPCPDVDPPETTITKGMPRRTEKRKARFAFVADEPGATFECKLDKGRWKPCSTPRKFKRVKRTRHRFKVRATDLAGNTDLSPARDRFRVVG